MTAKKVALERMDNNDSVHYNLVVLDKAGQSKVVGRIVFEWQMSEKDIQKVAEAINTAKLQVDIHEF